MQDELEIPKQDPQDPDEIKEDPEEDLEEEGDTLSEMDEEEQARAENGEVCADCGEEFTDANGSPALCSECFTTAEELGGGHKHPPQSRYLTLAGR